ncbi:serine/threonine-protein kinase [Nocardioides sp. SYSU D00038]|uniref:serine/threonine-protein kinase n=1 Tax=Nocardioides sp. SYSU D00038 TaxID=2812554 RepID=UPI001F0884E1|nr:serine/threonine-protein kinase [Nocardioides sp. SYSU D00038]
MPHRLGRYAVRRRIGSGAFATVWLAYDEHLDSPVAVKVLADNWTEDHHVRQRFLEEGRYLRRVESPHVVSVYDAGELEDGRPYLVMSYADQGTLADRLEVEGLTADEALDVVGQVAAGLKALHGKGILHRDVKPANVLFRSIDHGDDGAGVRVMLGDLGLGKALDVSSRLTMVAGTPSYVAPEQARAEPLDARADQYSLAVLTFRLLAGRAPYQHLDLAAAAEPGTPPSLTTSHGAAVDAVVRRGLAVDREDRFPDVSAYADALADALADGLADGLGSRGGGLQPLDPDRTRAGGNPTALPTAPSPAPGAPPPRRVPLARGAAALLLVAAAGVAGYLGQRHLGGDVTVTDADGVLSVTVPRAWDGAVSRDGWELDDEELPGLSVGTDRSWTDTAADGEGVFLGLLPGTRLPDDLPQHPECSDAEPRDDAATSQGDAVTVVHTDCPGGVTVERVVQVTASRLLWVQIRSADRATANDVLDSIDTHGLR